MSHRLGSVIPLSSPIRIGPGSLAAATSPGIWQVTFTPPEPLNKTKFLMLHFTGAMMTGGDRLEVDLGYGTDVFTATSGMDFWTRPIRGKTATIRYLDDGVATSSGIVTLSEFGRGEGLVNGGETNANGDVFLLDSPFVDPTFHNTYASCPKGSSPKWLNAECLPPGTIRDAARSVGMFVVRDDDHVSTCSATLIDSDLILTSAHCLASLPDIPSGSFTLDFRTDCAGNRPAGYSPRFHKFRRLVRSGFARAPGDNRPGLDYAIVQIETPTGGLGVPTIPIRPTAPNVGEDLFILHHPRGATKKVSRKPSSPQCQVLDIYPRSMNYVCDADNGSSGAPVLDAQGRIAGITWTVGDCNHTGVTATAILDDLATEPPPVQDSDVVLVLDRSGSMAAPGSAAGTTKIEEARQAAAMFIDLIRTDRNHRVSVVSFSDTASLNSPLVPLGTHKDALIGPAPDRDAGIIGGVNPGGGTSIGAGLQLAQAQFPPSAPGENIRTMLLMSDGLQNVGPYVQDVAPGLAGTHISAIGFGQEADLNGEILTHLARNHGGIYTRAGDGLALKKFFVLSFGNLFSSGIPFDPFYSLPAGEEEFDPLPFELCQEDTLTVVVAWDRPATDLVLALEAPGGSLINGSTNGVTESNGSTWTYLRMDLPLNGERDGTWHARVSRPGGGPEDERFCVTAVVDGGPLLRVVPEDSPVYTGDLIIPKVSLRTAGGFRVPAKVNLEVIRPMASIGELLLETGMREGREIEGEVLDARTSTLIELQQERGEALVPTETESYELFDDGEHGDGALEPDGIFAYLLPDVTRWEGIYTFVARARSETWCATSRETTWSVYVIPGIHQAFTEVEFIPIPRPPVGQQGVRIRFFPRDGFGTALGPGRMQTFKVRPGRGIRLYRSLRDGGDGWYTQDVIWDADTEIEPAILLVQSDREPVYLGSRGQNGAESTR